MMDNWGVLVAILGLGVLIAVHEFGHFIAGKLLGLKILEFVIGLPIGPKIASTKRGETTYGISAVLFGGYVKFAELLSITELKIEAVKSDSRAESAGLRCGDLITVIDGEPVKDWRDCYSKLTEKGDKPSLVTIVRAGKEEDLDLTLRDLEGAAISRDKQVMYEDIPRTFEAQKTWKRGLIVFSGPAMNLMLAVILIFSVSMIGLPKPTTVLERIMPKSPAAVVGIKAGDKIAAINGKPVRDWFEITRNIRRYAGKKITVTVERGDKRLNFEPILRKKSRQGLLGIATKVVRQPENPITAIKRGFYFIWEATLLIINFLGMLVTVPRKVLPFIRSPIGIVRETAPIAQHDILDYFTTLAGLSVAVGIFNLLPIPPLDGGRLFISGIEGVIRRPISREAMIVVNAVGFSLLLLLMTYAVIGDIFRKAVPGG